MKIMNFFSINVFSCEHHNTETETFSFLKFLTTSIFIEYNIYKSLTCENVQTLKDLQVVFYVGRNFM